MDNQKINNWNVYAASLAMTMGVAYLFCSIFDALFPAPSGLIRWLAPASPWPITGSVTGFITGLLMFIVAGFLFGAIYGITWGFWSKRLK
ncbi:MAG: hypothetical protein ABIT06_01340 [Saprospiraceae bacterium]